MALQVQGSSGTVADVGGTTFRALRVEARPLEYSSGLGHFRAAGTVSLLATQAVNGTLVSFRWGDATRLAVVQFIRMECLQTAAATATIMPSFQVFVARTFTASDSGGSQVITTGNQLKKRTSMGTSLVTDLRFSNAAAGLTVGTRTLDSTAILEMTTQQTITTPNATAYRKELDMTNSGDHPLVLAQNEGLIFRGPTVAFGAAGTANFAWELAWAEVNAY